MKKLINDLVQYSDAPALLKSPALSDFYAFTSVTITLNTASSINCVGIGFFDAVSLTVTLNDGTSDYVEVISYSENGLYLLSQTYTDIETVTLEHTGSLMGRFACGLARDFRLSKEQEPGFYSTHVPRTTASGQIIAGAGGIIGRRIGVDMRYTVDENIFNDLITAYPTQVGRGFPFFLYFDRETSRFPFTRMYAKTDNELLFQSSIKSKRWSRRFDYTEAF